MRRPVAVAAAAAAAAAVAAVLVGAGLAVVGGDRPGAQRDPAPVAPPAGLAGAPVPGAASASCVEEYGPDTLARRAFAFDGTVIAIGDSRSNDGGSADLDLAGVTFRVHTWFHGGSGAEAVADLDPPAGIGPEEGTPSYQVGTRLLVSGEARWGRPGDDLIAWGCGFTRYFDTDTARDWREATS